MDYILWLTFCYLATISVTVLIDELHNVNVLCEVSLFHRVCFDWVISISLSAAYSSVKILYFYELIFTPRTLRS